MALAHAILASLLNEQMTGYDLARRFGQDGYFWRATHQQIYRELARLEEQGAIADISLETGTRKNRQRTITEEGRRLLSAWIMTPSEPASIKEDVLVKCLAVSLVSPDELAKQILACRVEHQGRLEHHEATLCDMFPTGRPQCIGMVGTYLALSAGISYERAWITWADHAIDVLSASTSIG